MEALSPFFIVLFSGLFLSEFFQRVHLPWVIALIASGFIIGPSGFNLIEAHPVLEFLSSLGLIFVMFMAGIETNFFHKSRQENFGKAFVVATLGGTLSWVFGYILAGFLGMSLPAAVLLGIIFISSSVAVAVPILEDSGIIHGGLGKMILTTMIIQDVMSLIIFSIFSQFMIPEVGLGILIAYPILIISFFVLRKGIPMIRGYFVKEFHVNDRDVFEQELRAVLVLLIGIVAFFALLGIHEILAAFLAGMILTDLISHRDIKKNIHALGYGLFIPIFFASIGMTLQITDLNLQNREIWILLIFVIFGTLLVKYTTMYLGARLTHFSHKESQVVGASMIPQLSTTLALGFTGRQMGLFDDTLITALVLMCITSIIIAPLLLKFHVDQLVKK